MISKPQDSREKDVLSFEDWWKWSTINHCDCATKVELILVNFQSNKQRLIHLFVAGTDRAGEQQHIKSHTPEWIDQLLFQMNSRRTLSEIRIKFLMKRYIFCALVKSADEHVSLRSRWHWCSRTNYKLWYYSASGSTKIISHTKRQEIHFSCPIDPP
jgi:hypothetical protein